MKAKPRTLHSPMQRISLIHTPFLAATSSKPSSPSRHAPVSHIPCSIYSPTHSLTLKNNTNNQTKQNFLAPFRSKKVATATLQLLITQCQLSITVECENGTVPRIHLTMPYLLLSYPYSHVSVCRTRKAIFIPDLGSFCHRGRRHGPSPHSSCRGSFLHDEISIHLPQSSGGGGLGGAPPVSLHHRPQGRTSILS